MQNPFPGPVAPYSNVPIEPQWYNPSLFFISAVSTGRTTTITTTVNHNYVVGQNIRLLIPRFYGCWQINGQQGFVLSIPAANQVVVGINSQVCDPFISDPVYGPTPPQIIAIGDINTGLISSTGRDLPSTTIPGSFINVSPY